MRPFQFVIFLVLFLSGCGLFQGRERQGTGNIDGFVFTAVGEERGRFPLGTRLTPPGGYKEVEGVAVQVERTNLVALTDKRGYFLLEEVPVSERMLLVSKEGFLPVRVTVTVRKGETARARSEGADFIILPRARRVWTVMVYMGADNDMDEVADDDFNEMEMVGSSDEYAVVVEWDGWHGKGARRYLVEKDEEPTKVTSRILEDLGEVNTGDPVILTRFVKWATSAYPAQRYMLVLWDHGTGWPPRLFRPRPRATVFDWTNKDQLSTPELREALSESGVYVDILGFDACLMQMAEVAYEVRRHARYMVGSEENEPWEGWCYDGSLSRLASEPTMAPLQLAKVVVDEYIDSVDFTGWTLSVVDLSMMDEVGRRLDRLAKALINAWGQHKEKILSLINQTQQFGTETGSGGRYTDYRDLPHFALLLRERLDEKAVREAASSLLEVLSEAIPYSRYKGDPVKNARGLSIYLPESFPDELNKSSQLKDYRSLLLAKDTDWDKFLSLIPVKN